MRDVFIKELTNSAKHNPDIMLITGDLGFGVLDEFRKKFPTQFINAGLTESHMTSMAAGMAKEDKIVFTYSIGNFVSLRALEQLRIDVAYHESNVTAVCIGGGLSYGQLGMTHHATEDVASLRSMPNMQVFTPCDDFEVREITKYIAKGVGPSYLRLDKSTAGERLTKGRFTIGKMHKVCEGKDITFIAFGSIMSEVLKAVATLKQSGVSSRVLSAHSIKPLDEKSILSAANETGGIITVEEHVVDGGLGGAVAEVCLESSKRPKIFHRIGLHGFSEVVGDQDFLRSKYGIDYKSIVKQTLKILKK